MLLTEPRLGKTILFHILRNLPQLEVLKFHSNCEMKLSKNECVDLVTSIRNLESLDLSFIRCSLEPTSIKHRLPSMVYPKLTHLRLNFGSIEVTQMQSEILSRCRSLQCLSLGKIDLETFELICRDHVRSSFFENDVFLSVLRMHLYRNISTF